MAASIAFDGFGVVFKINSVALTDGEILTITDPNLDKEILETSHAGSVDQYKEFLGGFKDGGEINIDFNWTQDDFNSFKTEFEGSSNIYSIDIPDDNYSTTKPIWSFTGILKTISSDTDTKAVKVASASIKISGKPTFTDGT